ncbi:MAG: leucine--tRNA ligase [Myxococcales bacterium]|nr:leucine--tRNA ligase [Myxococcales bacterium]
MAYDPHRIEAEWQATWLERATFKSELDPGRPKYYVLDMFPYPSGEGLHVGHPKGFVATDVVARYKRMRGFNVLHPMGWDSFGLPAEQHAIKTGEHPRVSTAQNVANFKRQLQALGLSYDWDREIDTTDPGYVRWTQWIFGQLYSRDLAYQAEVPVNWCPALGTVLANEEVRDGRSDIGGHPVERVPLRQWMLRITAYADRLLEDLDEVDWPEPIKKMQRDWIGRSEGANVRFPLPDHSGEELEVFTTRPDTLFGATYMVLAPEHPLVSQFATAEQQAEVDQYVAQAVRKSDRSRLGAADERSGVFTGAFAINPALGERIPIWIAEYVLASYGTGAIMAVPGHDQRDYEFAQAFGLPIVEVVKGGDLSRGAYPGDGESVNSGFLDGLETPEAKRCMIDWLAEQGSGEASVSYKLRDWLFSRQRYWGEPFPVLHLADGSTRLVPEDELPVRLPELEAFRPSGDFEPPLARIADWIETRDPDTGETARRDANTMPQWAGSCWYYLRFCDPHNSERAWSREAEQYWMPVDLYVGGAEHAVLHLLYARFWHKVLYDLGLVSTKEPFRRLVNQGMVQGRSYRYFSDNLSQDPDARVRYYPAADVRWEGDTPVLASSGQELRACWVEPAEVRLRDDRPLHPDLDVELEEVIEKMSKSRGNVVNPDEVIAQFGADSMRVYELFMGPLTKGAPWSTDGTTGVYRFLQRSHRLLLGDEAPEGDLRELAPGPGTEGQRRLLARTVEKVTRDLEGLDFNTAISALMVFVRDVEKPDPIPRTAAGVFTRLLAPFAPHLAEELWRALGNPESISAEPWPEPESEFLVDEEVEIIVQVGGKLRARIRVPAETGEEAVRELALAEPNVARHVGDAPLRRVVFVPGRLLNLVI